MIRLYRAIGTRQGCGTVIYRCTLLNASEDVAWMMANSHAATHNAGYRSRCHPDWMIPGVELVDKP